MWLLLLLLAVAVVAVVPVVAVVAFVVAVAALVALAAAFGGASGAELLNGTVGTDVVLVAVQPHISTPGHAGGIRRRLITRVE